MILSIVWIANIIQLYLSTDFKKKHGIHQCVNYPTENALKQLNILQTKKLRKDILVEPLEGNYETLRTLTLWYPRG